MRIMTLWTRHISVAALTAPGSVWRLVIWKSSVVYNWTGRNWRLPRVASLEFQWVERGHLPIAWWSWDVFDPFWLSELMDKAKRRYAKLENRNYSDVMAMWNERETSEINVGMANLCLLNTYAVNSRQPMSFTLTIVGQYDKCIALAHQLLRVSAYHSVSCWPSWASAVAWPANRSGLYPEMVSISIPMVFACQKGKIDWIRRTHRSWSDRKT